jgi:hypothetical protein
MTTSSGLTTRILPTPTGIADSFPPTPTLVLLLPRRAMLYARAESNVVNALPRTGDGVTGPTESAGDEGALLSLLPFPAALPPARGVNARAVGSKRRCCCC